MEYLFIGTVAFVAGVVVSFLFDSKLTTIVKLIQEDVKLLVTRSESVVAEVKKAI